MMKKLTTVPSELENKSWVIAHRNHTACSKLIYCRNFTQMWCELLYNRRLLCQLAWKTFGGTFVKGWKLFQDFYEIDFFQLLQRKYQHKYLSRLLKTPSDLPLHKVTRDSSNQIRDFKMRLLSIMSLCWLGQLRHMSALMETCEINRDIFVNIYKLISDRCATAMINYAKYEASQSSISSLHCWKSRTLQYTCSIIIYDAV